MGGGSGNRADDVREVLAEGLEFVHGGGGLWRRGCKRIGAGAVLWTRTRSRDRACEAQLPGRGLERQGAPARQPARSSPAPARPSTLHDTLPSTSLFHPRSCLLLNSAACLSILLCLLILQLWFLPTTSRVYMYMPAQRTRFHWTPIHQSFSALLNRSPAALR